MSQPEATEQITETERQEILTEIDELTAIAVTPPQVPFRPKRHGFLFPVMVNLTAAALVVLTIVMAARFYDRRQMDLQLETASFLTAESAIIGELRRENEQRLEAKEAEISRVRDELERLDVERRELERGLDQAIEDRERALREELSRELTAERARLADAGRSETQISEALEVLEARRLQGLEAELQAARRDAREAIRDREEAIAAAELAARVELDVAQAERRQLLIEAAEREAALADELAQVESERRYEALVTERILADYRELERLVGRGLHQDALAAIQRLRQVFVSGPDASLSIIASRRPTELFVLDSLETLVRSRIPRQENGTPAALASAANALAAGDPDLAFRTYRGVLSDDEIGDTARSAADGMAQAYRLSQDLLSGRADRTAAELEERIRALTIELSGSQAETRRLEARARSLAAEGAEAKARSDELASEAAALSRRIEGLETALSESQVAERDAEAGRTAAERQAAAEDTQADRELAGLRTQLSEARSDLRAANAELTRMRSQRDSLEARQAQLQERVAFLTERAEDRSELEAIRAAVSEAVSDHSDLPLRTAGSEAAQNGDSLALAIVSDLRLILAQAQTLEVVAAREVRLVGTVVSVSEQTIVLEPLTISSLSTGDSLWIRRRGRDRELIVGQAEVLRINDGRIQARLTDVATTPLVLDLVYAEVTGR